MVNGVFDVEACATVNQQADDGFMARKSGVMERSGVGMEALRVIAVGIFAGFEKETHDIGVTQLSGKGEGAMPAFRVGCRKEFL